MPTKHHHGARPRALPSPQRLFAALLLVFLGACSHQQARLPEEHILAASRPAEKQTTIALLGGTGFVGGYILSEALAQGYPLRVLARSPEKLAYLADRIDIVTGDARDPAVLRALLDGADVVINAIGPPRAAGDSRAGLNTAVSRAMLAAMGEAGLDRYIVVSGAGVAIPGDRRNLRGWWMRQLVRLRYPGILQDRQKEYALLASSGVNWTLLRCPLIEGAVFASSPQVSLATPGGFYLRAGELARFALGQIDNGDYARNGPFLSSE